MKKLLAVSPKGLRFAVIGLGRMGVRHIEAAQNMGMILIGGADVDEEARGAFVAGHGLPAECCFSDGHALLKTLRPEALVVATTAPTHAHFVIAAARSGVKHILCEKPMASSIADAELMLTACRDAGARLAVNHQMRFMDQYAQVKTLIADGALGPLSSVLVAGSNFGLAMNASHYFEMFRFLTGEPIAEIQAWLEAEKLDNPRGAEFEDASGRLLARNREGATLYIDFSAHSGWGLQTTYICRNGQIVVDELSGDIRMAVRELQFRDMPTNRYALPTEIEHLKALPKEVVQSTGGTWLAMLEGSSWPDGEIGAYTLRCLVAAHVSNRAGGQMVAIDSADLPADEVFAWA